MNLSWPQKIVLFSGLSLIGLLLFISLVICPLLNKVSQAAQEYLTNQEILVRLDQREFLAKQLEEEYQEKETELEDLAKVFLGSEETVGFITNLEAIARQTGNFFEIKAVSPYGSSEDEEETFLDFRISLWGNFSGLLLFLANLENSPYPPYRLVEIENMTIKRLATEDSTRFDFSLKEGDLETILSVKIYTQ